MSTIGIGYDMQTHSVTVTDPEGCESSLSINIAFDFAACTGVEEPGSGKLCRIYPNPGDGTLHIVFAESVKDAEIMVSNPLGQIVWGPEEYKGIAKSGEVMVSLGKQPGGIYFIHIRNRNSAGDSFRYILRK